MALDVVYKTGKTPVLGRMLSKYVGRKTSSIENGITKARNHSRQRGNIMRVVFGIDVSKASSEVAILINGEKVHGYTIPNDAIGFNRLLGDLKTVHQPEIVFEATGVYSRRLQAFFEDNSYAYTRLNPLESKKQLDSLRVRKTDKIDAEKLATSQFILVNQAMSKKRFTKNYATSAVSIRILLRILSALKTVCTRFYRSLFLNWKTSCRHQLGNNIGTW